jgi:Na+(H+)/acetate symporter ActP
MQTTVYVLIGLVAWLGLAICLAVAVGLTIHAADEHDKHGRWDW